MSANLKSLETVDEKSIKSAAKVLLDAATEGFVGVAVIGLRPDGKSVLLTSAGLNVLWGMGACMRAAIDINAWSGDERDAMPPTG